MEGNENSMSWLKRIGLVVISLLLLVLMVAYACPAKVHVESRDSDRGPAGTCVCGSD